MKKLLKDQNQGTEELQDHLWPLQYAATRYLYVLEIHSTSIRQILNIGQYFAADYSRQPSQKANDLRGSLLARIYHIHV